MKKVIIDANIIINVWAEETDPASGNKLFVASSKVLELVFTEKLRGILLTTTAMEILHCVRVNAELARGSASFAMKKAERELFKSGLLITIPDAGIMGSAYDTFMELHLDPYDAVMVAAAKLESADAIISRDKKLKKKASRVVPIITPEEYLAL